MVKSACCHWKLPSLSKQNRPHDPRNAMTRLPSVTGGHKGARRPLQRGAEIGGRGGPGLRAEGDRGGRFVHLDHTTNESKKRAANLTPPLVGAFEVRVS